jgi:TolB-like protein/Tfp pilus assembly protein PilF
MEESDTLLNKAGSRNDPSLQYDVFISHSTKDKAAADAVCAALEARGIRCWIAPRNIQPGADWGESILRAIASVKVVALVLSKNANASTQIKREVERAVHHRRTIIPLRIENVTPAQSLEYFLSTAQWLDAFNHPLEHHLDHIAATLEEIITGQKNLMRPTTAAITSRANRKLALALGIVAALAILAGAVWWQTGFLKKDRPSAPSANALPVAPSVPLSDKSIAVLPFQNLSQSEENAFFADGVQEEILTDLARIADLKVISRTSVQQYRSGIARNIREIAHALGVAFILEGSVQRAGNNVRVTAQLIDGRNDANVWAEHFDGDLVDVFGIQTRIAQAIADQLRVRLSPTEKAAMSRPLTIDPTAHDFFLRANQLLSQAWADYNHAKAKLAEALDLFDKATARDPNFLLAYCRASQAHITLYWLEIDHTPERLKLADDAIRKAEQIQPDSDDVHFARGWYFFQGLRDYEQARRELRLAQRTFPNNADILSLAGSIDRRQGDWKKSTEQLLRAVDLDPGNLFRLQQLASSYHVLRRYSHEEAIYNRALIVAPDDKAISISRARIDLDARADTRRLRETISKLMQRDLKAADEFPAGLLDQALCDRDPAAAERALAAITPGELIFFFNTPPSFVEAFMARCLGENARAQSAFKRARAEQEKLVKEQPNFASGLSILGIIDAGLGRKDEAIREGERACQLTPLKKDVIDGAELMINLALIYAWTGEKDRAFEQLTTLAQTPTNLSYGLLKLHPQWDSLRNDPRFESLLTRFQTEPDQ